MRHNKKFNHLGRTSSHRNAMLSNMCISIIKEKRIYTTVAKAKAVRKVLEPIVNRSKEDTTHSRRLVFQALGGGAHGRGPVLDKEDRQNKKYYAAKEAVAELFQEIGPKVANRNGGYTRIIKTGYRLGDNASMCFIELVDFNEDMLKQTKEAAKPKTRRSRRSSGAAKATEATVEPKVDAKEAKTEE